MLDTVRLARIIPGGNTLPPHRSKKAQPVNLSGAGYRMIE